MQLNWSYWYFRDAIPENVCDHIIKEGLSRKKQIAKIGHGDKGPTRDYKKHPLTQEEKLFVQQNMARQAMAANQDT